MFADWSKQWNVLKEIVMGYTAITDEQLELCVKEKRDWYITAKQ